MVIVCLMSYGKICMWTIWNAFKQRVCACVYEWLRKHMFEVNPCPPVSWAEISLIKWQKEDRWSSLSQPPAILPDAQLWQYSSLELLTITNGLHESLKGALIYIFIACYFIVKSTYNPVARCYGLMCLKRLKKEQGKDSVQGLFFFFFISAKPL